jgi:hypothetical protein
MGLTLPYRFKKRAIQCLGQRDILDIVHSNMGIDAGLHVSVGIDVKISPSSGNASANMGTIIPEIKDEQRLASPEFYDLFSEMVSLFWGDHKMDIALAIDGQIEEIHLGDDSFSQEMIHPLFGRNNFNIIPCHRC